MTLVGNFRMIHYDPCCTLGWSLIDYRVTGMKLVQIGFSDKTRLAPEIEPIRVIRLPLDPRTMGGEWKEFEE